MHAVRPRLYTNIQALDKYLFLGWTHWLKLILSQVKENIYYG